MRRRVVPWQRRYSRPRAAHHPKKVRRGRTRRRAPGCGHPWAHRRASLLLGGRRGSVPVVTLTVWTFNSTGAADDALPVLARLVSEGAVVVEDAAVVSWPEGRRKPSGRPVKDVFGEGMLWEGTWGMILGMIFLVPIAGPSFGAAAGAFAGALWNLGLDDTFVKSVRDTVTPGTSALFALCDEDA